MKQTTINLPDDFEKGQCDICPFMYEEFYVNVNTGFDRFCVFGWKYDKCELEVVEK